MSDVLQTLSNALADTVQAASGGIVRVEGRKRLAGTGMVWSGDGLIVAANHVVTRDEGIKVGLADGQVVAAKLVGRDPNSDVAVLRVEAQVSPLARAGADSPLRVGHLVLAAGRPGENVQVTLGVVSAIGSGRMQGVIQTDVVMYPGFSGGPLIDASGYVRGMNTSGFMRGASVAVSVVTISTVVETLVKHGRMRQGFLGVGAQPVRLPQAVADQLGQETGLMLAAVESGSPAEAAGLFQGDTLVALDGQATRSMDELLALLGGDRIGATVALKIVRAGQVHDLSVTIGEKP